MEKSASDEQKLNFWSEWIRNFSSNVDLKVKGQIRAIALLEAMERQEDAERIRQDIITATRSKRFDLGITMAADADKTLSAQEPFSLLDEVPNQMVRIFLKASGKGIKIPNRRQLDSYEAVIDFYGSGQSSQYALKLAKHTEKTGKWALMDRVSDGFRAGRAAYLKARAKRAA